MDIRTHLKIDKELSGTPVKLEEGYAEVLLKTSEKMAVDEKGLLHGGFIFSCGDYSAMLAVNHPNVVLAGANVKFLKPVKVGDEIICRAKVEEDKGNKKTVKVECFKSDTKVFEGIFYTVIPEKHVLER
ncbi:MAG: thioesterase [Aquifex sp.]|nr:MAG: thioesterase [Aquifex sp.]